MKWLGWVVLTCTSIAICENTTYENESSLDKVLACVKDGILGIRNVKFLL